MKASTKAIRFLQTLAIPEGPLAGQRLKLAPFQKQFVTGALAPSTDLAILSVGRGNAKSAVSAGLGIGALIGVWDKQPRRDIIIAARTRDQARVAWNFAAAFCTSLPDDIQRQIIFRRSPRLEISFEGDGGNHVLRAIAADGKSALGSGPTMVVMDERGHWQSDKGDALEQALLTGLGKRGGKALLISTSAPDDTHPFSRWIDNPPPGAYVQEHRPAPGLPADDLASIIQANPGAEYGVGASIEWLQASARRAIIVTDGVFSMRGDHAPLDRIMTTSEHHDDRYPENVVVVVDDSHGVGAFGATGRGTEEVTAPYPAIGSIIAMNVSRARTATCC